MLTLKWAKRWCVHWWEWELSGPRQAVLSVASLKTKIKVIKSLSAFYYCHATVILNNGGAKMLLSARWGATPRPAWCPSLVVSVQYFCPSPEQYRNL